MLLRFFRAFTLSCACSAAAATLAVLTAPSPGFTDDPMPTRFGLVVGYTVFNAVAVLVLHTPLLLGLKWATRNKLNVSPWVWAALGLIIPMVADLGFTVADLLQNGYDVASWEKFWQLGRLEFTPETLVFSSLMPTMIGGAVFGGLLFKPGS